MNDYKCAREFPHDARGVRRDRACPCPRLNVIQRAGNHKGRPYNFIFALTFTMLLTFAFGIVASAQIAVRGETVYTMAGAPIKDGVVLVNKGKIERVGAASQIQIPASYRVLTAKVVTPGLIDAHTVVGLSGYLNQPNDQDQLERSSPVQPDLRAYDAYNTEEKLIGVLRGYGITTIHTGHGPGALISGQTMIVKTRDAPVDEIMLVPTAMIAATLGESGFGGQGRSPGTRAKQIAMLRAELQRAKEFVTKQATQPATRNEQSGGQSGQGNADSQDARNAARGNAPRSAQNEPDLRSASGASPSDNAAQGASAGNNQRSGAGGATPPSRDLRMEAMARVIRRETPLLITAHRQVDILNALRLAKEFNIRIVLDGASEAYQIVNQIKAANVPVIVHPTMYRAGNETENLTLENASLLRRAGIPVALQSGFEGYVPKTRVVLFEAGVAAANGLSFEDALGTITIDAARILGISNRVGSLEAGKDADVAMFDGDPFEYTTHVTGVLLDGATVSQEAH